MFAPTVASGALALEATFRQSAGDVSLPKPAQGGGFKRSFKMGLDENGIYPNKKDGH